MIICDDCGIKIYDDDFVETIEDKKVCFGCDSKRLIREQ